MMQGVMDAALTQNGQNALASAISQEAGSEVSGISFGSYANSENEISNTMISSMDFTSEISQECSQASRLEQSIQIESGGNVKFTDNVMSVLNRGIASCAMAASSTAELANSLDTSTEQKATATVAGLTGMEFVIVLIVGMIAFGGVGIVGTKAITKTAGSVTGGIFGNFPIILALGCLVMGALMIGGCCFQGPTSRRGSQL